MDSLFHPVPCPPVNNKVLPLPDSHDDYDNAVVVG